MAGTCKCINELSVSKKYGEFLDQLKKVIFSRKILLHGVRKYIGADKSLARPTSPCILFDGENISFDASHVIYIYIYIYIVLYSSNYDNKYDI